MLTGKEEFVSMGPDPSDHTHCAENSKHVVTALPVCEKAVELGLLHTVNVVLVT